MSISINDSTYGYLTQMSENARSSAAADSVNSSVNKINANSSEAEMKQAIKDFESYFIEQILKKVEDTFTSEDSTANNQMTEYFMGSVNEKLADQILDQVGERTTQMLYEQMKRNYNITDAETE